MSSFSEKHDQEIVTTLIWKIFSTFNAFNALNRKGEHFPLFNLR